MTTFISRDYNPAASGYINLVTSWDYTNGGAWGATESSRVHCALMYELSIFLHKILGYSIVGQTNWNINNTNIKSLNVTAATNTAPIQITTATPHGLIDGYTVSITGAAIAASQNSSANGTWAVSVVSPTQFNLIGSLGNGTYTSGSGTMTSGFQYASGLVSDGYGAGINFGLGFIYEVSVPVFKRTVVAGDIGKILTLRSTAYPTKNAGLFKITGVNTGSNRYIIDYRSTEAPPPEAANAMDWWLFESETIVSGYFDKFAQYWSGSTAYAQVYGSTNASPIVVNIWPSWPVPWVTGQKVTVFGHSSNTNANGNWVITQTVDSSHFILGPVTTIAAGSNSQSLPQTTISVTSTAGFATVGTVYVATGAGLQTVTYTGISGNTFTGCSGGTGAMSTGGAVNASSGNGASGDQSGGMSLLSYNGGSAQMSSRIILQSPHASGWQVRISSEPYNNGTPHTSMAVGYGGNSIGDFAAGGLHTHVPQFLDINPAVITTYQFTAIGGGHTTVPSRISIVGDDQGQSVFVYTKSTGVTNNGIITFGIPSNEPAPLPSHNASRLFCYGSAVNAAKNGSGGDYGNIVLRTGTNVNAGFSVSPGGAPEYCALTSWGNLDGTSGTNPMATANASDSVFSSTTEVLPVEVWAGVATDTALSFSNVQPFSLSPRFMGTAPFLRSGRCNYTAFTISTDEVVSRTVTAASNSSPIQITTSVANTLTTGQTVTISGVTGNTAANGTWVITVIDTSNFTLNGSVGNGGYGGGGTVNGCPRWLHLQNGIFLQWNGPAGLTP